MLLMDQKRTQLNLRLLIILLVIAVPVGWFVWTFASLALSHGKEETAEGTLVNLKEMGNFSFNEVTGTLEDVPAIWRELDGKRVVFKGQMYVDYTTAPLVNSFQLVYSIQNCCFNGPPKVQERVFANSAKAVPVYAELAKVSGILHVRLKRENGKIVSVFDMDVQSVAREQ